MCGRYTLTAPGDVLRETFGLDAAPELAPRYNVAPTQEVAIVRTTEAGKRELALVRWGLVPFWAKERAIGARLINARAESLAEKPAYRDSFRKRRCLIPATGFYEWQARAGGKQPWLFRMRDGSVFAFAGLWSRWNDRESGLPLDTCAIVTTEPDELAATVHDRMPVVLPRDGWPSWLAADTPASDLAALCAARATPGLIAHPVSRLVNSPANDLPACLEPVEL
jgi:putative SOS response-associated peptidase YedK